ncbi:MAG: hypothetical protein LBQ33_04740, partial [Oscillospiraceae bacterium]|nr:hypothetical protein [Oscillospiraceae bacterium]
MKRNRFLVVMVGLLVIAAGCVILAVNVFHIPWALFDGWWTVLIAAFAVASMVKSGIHFGNAFLLGFAGLLLAYEQGWIANGRVFGASCGGLA